MAAQPSVSPRVQRVLKLIERLEPEERLQLGQMLPGDLSSIALTQSRAVEAATEYFRAKGKNRQPAPSLDDTFIGGLTYRQYFSLPDEEADRLWEELERLSGDDAWLALTEKSFEFWANDEDAIYDTL